MVTNKNSILFMGAKKYMPFDLLVMILAYLDFSECSKNRRTCTQFNKAILEAYRIQRKICIAEWNPLIERKFYLSQNQMVHYEQFTYALGDLCPRYMLRYAKITCTDLPYLYAESCLNCMKKYLWTDIDEARGTVVPVGIATGNARGYRIQFYKHFCNFQKLLTVIDRTAWDGGTPE